MSEKNVFFDASILRIKDDAAVKVTFLKGEKGKHFVGFYSMVDGVFQDVRTLFSNTEKEALIPGVSSVFLGNRLNGKTPVFFIVENGVSLNKNTSWFLDAGHGGTWKFLKPVVFEDAVLALNQGKIVWQRPDGEIIEQAQNADVDTKTPVLAWQSNDGQVFSVKGNVFHSLGGGLHSGLNPDLRYRFFVMPQEDGNSIVLDFVNMAEQKTEMSFNLHIGERNLTALTLNRVIGAVSVWPRIETSVLSVRMEIPDDFEDTLYVEGFEKQTSVLLESVNFLIEGSYTNKLTIKGAASLDVYQRLLARIKIKTKASAEAKSNVKFVFQTEKEEIVIEGQTEILSEQSRSTSLLTGFPLTKSVSENKTGVSSGIFSTMVLPDDKNRENDEIPSFLTQSVPSRPTAVVPANGKTVLITGGACKRGAAVAHAFASNGYNVIVHCHTAAAQAAALVEELKQKYHIKAAYFRADFNSYEETADLIPTVTKAYGTIDVLVCHAFAFIKEESEQGWNQSMAVNVRAPFVLMRSFAQCLPKGREGTIVSVFSQSRQELSSHALVCSLLPELTALAANVYKNKIKVGALSVDGTLFDDSQNKKIAETVCFLAQNPLASGQILKMETEKKTSLF